MSRGIKMPELSFAKRFLRSRKIPPSSFEFSADQIEAVKRLVGHSIAEVECELIIQTLADQRGCRTSAAKLLGISLRTLRNKICEYNEHGIIVPQPDGWRGASNGFSNR
jgi:DNA-binding NtrC family response regulator